MTIEVALEKATHLVQNMGSVFADDETRVRWIQNELLEAYRQGKKDEEIRIERAIGAMTDSEADTMIKNCRWKSQPMQPARKPNRSERRQFERQKRSRS